MTLSAELRDQAEVAVRAIAERHPLGSWFLDELTQSNSAGALRLALDVASADGVHVEVNEIAAAKSLVEHLDAANRDEAGIAYSIRNSLKLLAMRDLVAV